MSMNSILKDRKILVIDDEPSMISIVKEVLNRAGAKPTSSSSAKEGLKMAANGNYDVIILDRYMPDGDGHDILKTLKETPHTQDTPVVMLTGEKDIEQIQESITLGAVGYIGKPFTPKSFFSQLDKVLADKLNIWQL